MNAQARGNRRTRNPRPAEQVEEWCKRVIARLEDAADAIREMSSALQDSRPGHFAPMIDQEELDSMLLALSDAKSSAFTALLAALTTERRAKR